jgi:Eco57I restriction-modification methylase
VTGLDAAQRAALERLIVRARSILEKDLEAQAEGRYGINRDGRIEDEAALHLDSSALADRREIVAIVEHLCNEGETTTGAVARLIREAAFTHLNRLVAIRVAEAMGLVPPSLAEGHASQGFREVLEVAPLVAGDETGGYWTYLRLCGDEMASDAPVLFDPRNPLLTLSPSPTALDDLVELFADRNLREIWTGSDTFGWTYQFFNTSDERRQMREESGAPRNSRELAVRNQFFTPRYVVDFLVQNTLGRRLIEAQPDSALIDALPLLIDPPTEAGDPLPLDEVRIFDPACGSGHFLLGCYDVLERAWQLQGVEPADAATLIVPTLWGIDIDPRCAQVASAAIVFRARRHCRRALPRPNVITARALPDGSDSWERVLAALPSDRRDLVQHMREALAQAPVLGPLLKVEEQLAAEIRRHFTGSEIAEGTLAEGIAPDAFGAVESQVLDALQQVADSAASTVGERLLAAEGGDAVRFVEAVRQRYDIILMNPPFGEPVGATRDYLRDTYPWLPTRTADLFAIFVGRGLELCKETGYLGAITSRSGMFLSTFERWRREVLLAHHLVALADLGSRVMEGALVESAAYIVGARARSADARGSFIRLVKEVDRETALSRVARELRATGSSSLCESVVLDELQKIPRAPVAYWIAPSIRALFASLPALQPAAGEVRVGLKTSDDFRFVRALWEVPPTKIARSSSDSKEGKRWAPFAKGGEFARFYGDIHLAVEWESNGQRLWEDVDAESGRPRSNIWMLSSTIEKFFDGGLTWPRRTASGFGVRLLPRGTAFGDKGPAVIPKGETAPLLGWLTSRLCESLVGVFIAAAEETASGTPSKGYEAGIVQRLPWIGPSLNQAVKAGIGDATTAVVRALARMDEGVETSRRFVCPELLRFRGATLVERVTSSYEARYSELVGALERTYEVERAIHRALSLEDEAEQHLDDEYGPHPCSYPDIEVDDAVNFARLSAMPVDQVIDETIATRGGSRFISTKSYFVDRRLEIFSHVFRRHPRAVAAGWSAAGSLPPEEPREAVAGLMSWLVGAAFGRWDSHVAAERARFSDVPDVFDTIPTRPPGLRADGDSRPGAAIAADNSLNLNPAGLRLDEPGHASDIEAAVQTAAESVFADATEDVLTEMLEILQQKGIRDYLRRRFFKDHLSRYSKSRRKAPIYWPLTVASRRWGVWVYAPSLSRETLFAVASEAARREALTAEGIRRLQSERDAGGAGRSARHVSEALAAEEALAEELGKFRAEADRIAGLGWEPDLDDGIILCAAPLASLFPAWPDAGKEREQIRKGEYPWATVSRWKDTL